MPSAFCGAAIAAMVTLVALTASAAPSGRAATHQGPSAAEAAAPCNYYYEWNGKVRFPLQNDPHATYTYVVPSNEAAKDGVGFLVRGQFVHSVWTSWLTYTRGAKPFSGANFVNNPPANSYNPIVADPGSIDPFTRGEPMLGAPRNFTLLFKERGYPWDAVASSLDGTPKANIARTTNVKPYPRPKHGNYWALANRNYQALPGYNPGGTRITNFPVVTAVDLKTGKAVNCQKYNVLPNRLQRPPSDPPSKLNYGHVPIRIALKNGSHFDPLGGLGRGGHSQFAPKNPRGLVQFTRAPKGPGADVATVHRGDNCAGYLATRTSTRLVSLVRIPHIANYTDTHGVTPSTTFPNPVHRPWQASYMSFSMYGTSSGFYLPGDPDTMSIADRQFKVDPTGGSTVLVWPRSLSKRDQQRVFHYARKNGWPIVRGGTSGRQASANVLIRIKGANRTTTAGSRSCRASSTSPRTAISRERDPGAGRQRVGRYREEPPLRAPQGVTCRSIRR